MSLEDKLTRRQAVQGMVLATVAALMPEGADSQTVKHYLPERGPSSLPDAQQIRAFNDQWRFHRGEASGAQATSFNDAEWRTVEAPHDWSIEDTPAHAETANGTLWTQGTRSAQVGPFDLFESEGQIATGWTVGGIGWYRKTFPRPQLRTPSGRVEVRFEGIYMNSDVWINGVHLGNHPYGYTEVVLDLTPHLVDGQNTLAVRVNNAGANSRWYSGSGLFRKVWLAVKGDLRIPNHGVFVTTPQVDAKHALVNVEVAVENGAANAGQAKLRVRILDNKGQTVAEDNKTVGVPATGTAKTICQLSLNAPRLWSPGDPYLYRAEVTLATEAGPIDSTSLMVGVRQVEIDAARGLRINGEAIKLRGGCVHHDNGPLGAASIPRAEERRVEILKANGYNAIRTSHNPPSRDFLDSCDRLGMLVIDEAFDGWEAAKNPQDYHLYFNDWCKRDLESMILRDRNHPSVILWSIGNETKERAEPRGLEIGKELAARAHELDPTRKVTAAICGPYDHPTQTWQDMQPAFTYLDVGGYNYLWKEYQNDHVKYPDRVIVGTESYPSEAFQNWRAVEQSNWVIGDFVWTAIDYIGESGLGRMTVQKGPGRGGGLAPYPWFSSYCGDIDLIGNKKPQSYFRDIVWGRSPVEMAVQRPLPKGWTEHPSWWGWNDELRSWTWPGFDESPMTVRVYTKGSLVKLRLNGKEVGSKQLSEQDNLKAEFIVPYSPGELKAVAYENGKQIGTTVLKTAGKAHTLVLTADRLSLEASRDDLSYVMVTVTDERGEPLPDAVVPVRFSVEGVGELAAVGNSNPKDVASFRLPQRDTFHGACVAILRPTGSRGAISLQAESPGLRSASIRLHVGS